MNMVSFIEISHSITKHYSSNLQSQKVKELHFKNLEDKLQHLTKQHKISQDAQILRQIKVIKHKMDEIYKEEKIKEAFELYYKCLYSQNTTCASI